MTTRPRLLVSVRTVSEANKALAGGADVIDIKEPDNGPLGRATPQIMEQIVGAVAGQAPVSAALGELVEWAEFVLPSNLRYAKVGLAGAPTDWPVRLAGLFNQLVPVAPIAVAYADDPQADAPSVGSVLRWACEYGAEGLLIDTADKRSGGLFDWASPEKVSGWINAAHDAGLMIALAGSLRGNSLLRAIELGPDLIAVRGAACINGDRHRGIDPSRVRALAHLVSTHNTIAAQPVD